MLGQSAARRWPWSWRRCWSGCRRRSRCRRWAGSWCRSRSRRGFGCWRRRGRGTAAAAWHRKTPGIARTLRSAIAGNRWVLVHRPERSGVVVIAHTGYHPARINCRGIPRRSASSARRRWSGRGCWTWRRFGCWGRRGCRCGRGCWCRSWRWARCRSWRGCWTRRADYRRPQRRDARWVPSDLRSVCLNTLKFRTVKCDQSAHGIGRAWRPSGNCCLRGC
jgi:hypothetical protein